MAEAGSKSTYDRAYYESHCGTPYRRDDHWVGFFAGIADAIMEQVAPVSVLDAGCAMGFLVEALRDRGIEAWGIDISDYAISEVREDIKPFCRVASITEPLGRHYDLIVTIEVLEHLDEETGRVAIANLCAHSEDIIFSSSPHDEEEETHANVRPTEYWAGLFLTQGFLRDPAWIPSGGLPPWTIRFRRGSVDAAAVVERYEALAYRLLRRAVEAAEGAAALEARIAANAAHAAEVIGQRDQIIAGKNADMSSLQEELRAIRESVSYRAFVAATKPARAIRRRLRGRS